VHGDDSRRRVENRGQTFFLAVVQNGQNTKKREHKKIHFALYGRGIGPREWGPESRGKKGRVARKPRLPNRREKKEKTMKQNSKKASKKNFRNAAMVKETAAPKYNAKVPAPAAKAPAAAKSPAPAKASSSPAPAKPAAALPGRTPEGKAAAVKSAAELAKKVVPETKPAAKDAKKPETPKAPKEKPFTKSRVDVDTSAYYKVHSKLPGTGKREPKTLWKFMIGKEPFQMETEFFRTARLAAVEKAVSMKCEKVAVLA